MRKSDIDRFYSHVRKTDGCWIWTGSRCYKGYGRFGYMGRNFRAHRWIYAALVGAIPDGLLICHHCDNPACVRLDHLFMGTASDNMQDMHDKGRWAKADSRGEKHPLATFTEKEAFEIKYGPRKLGDGVRLAKKFGVTPSTIYQIWRGYSWRHL